LEPTSKVAPTVAPAAMGRPPKNMCTNCKGWGRKFHANWAIEYYGNGEEVKRKQTSDLYPETCRSCKGSGIKGGVLRTEDAPVLELLKMKAPEQAKADKAQAALEAQPADEELPV
jgi:hypothetical protein